MKVYQLNIKQKEAITGQKYDEVSYFNPVQDASGNWIISQIEVNNCTDIYFEWLKDCPLIDFEPPENIETDD